MKGWLCVYKTIIRAFYRESENYSSSMVNVKKRVISCVPEIKTKEHYKIALEEAVFELIAHQDAECILKVLQDAKRNEKLPDNFKSMLNVLTLKNGKATALTFRVKNREVSIYGDRILISSRSCDYPKKKKADFKGKFEVLQKTVVELQKLYTKNPLD